MRREVIWTDDSDRIACALDYSKFDPFVLYFHCARRDRSSYNADI